MRTTHQSIEIRVDRFVRERLVPAVEIEHNPVLVEVWEAPGEPVPFAEARTQSYAPIARGRRWGRPWGTIWLRVRGTVPPSWGPSEGAIELIIDPGFIGDSAGFQVEALVYDPSGRTIKGIEPRNDYVRVHAQAGESFEFYVEAAANPNIIGEETFAPTTLGRLESASNEPLYRLGRIELVRRSVQVWELIQDVETVRGLAHELPSDSARRAQLYAALDDAVDAVEPDAVHDTVAAGREALRGVLAAPAAQSAHRVFAVGHAHLDSAWLWPTRETVRKCARTFSNVLDLMDADPALIFACSSAQQFVWVQDHYPELFERIRARVADGRFVPVGSMWVESDTNLPGAEALVRQFVEGKRFFLEEFGIETTEVWLPDSFGYTAALPQIARAAGAHSFLTQKLSWNEVNAFPHHSFQWEGIDGTRIFAHMPPVDTYNSMLTQSELAHTASTFTEKGRADVSLVPFGFGDGGGGPTREMMAAARRAASLEGSPVVRFASPSEFFAEAEAQLEHPPVWVGELYLESHRGVYASQARTKRGNRTSEALLHEAELWAATAAVRIGAPYPAALLRSAWRTVLLNQFHDILPGSSIGWVYDQTEEEYRQVAATAEEIIGTAFAALGQAAAASDLRANSGPFQVDGVPAHAIAVARTVGDVTVESVGDDYVLANGLIRARIDRAGHLRSLVDLASGRELIPAGERGGVLQLFTDVPRRFDAWDVDVEYRRSQVDLDELERIEVVTLSPELVTIEVERTFGRSRVVQTLSLGAGRAALDLQTTVNWHERQKMLKLSFPVDVHTSSAKSEIQFGHIERATHTNTSWDEARFETVAHRWVHVADRRSGLGVVNDAVYGHDVTRQARAGGGTFSVVRQTLLKAPLFPDPEADQGEHVFRTTLVPGTLDDAIREGYRLQYPLRPAAASPGASPAASAASAVAVEPLVTSDSAGVVVETVKLADDGSGDVVVRLYESLGEQAHARVRANFTAAEPIETDLLERAVTPSAVVETVAGAALLSLRPFQLVTLRFGRLGGAS
ncbi:alpha-mannosidase [Glaciibacter psychrotolerans]|uniref:Alpha-mannosidase n=1 Tax=Glaciibacter psychrotolerans TaxID=670054 RepID=A0A7Z0J4P9_9MICO|nr:glycoside hydrolase family 38 C-terminal domain-containing protein [Leifsonia psychrotolerans]NYJ18560.1 alpha-mannosidase [Leifsonia psychrotolerans]